MGVRARVVTAALLVASGALAEPRDPAAAEALFREGRAEMREARFASACEKFAESQRLDPAVGTLLNLADCEEKRGRLARAWEHYVHALELLAEGDPRHALAASRRDALAPRVPLLAITLARSAPQDAEVRRDDVIVAAASFGSAIPVEPGEHVVVVLARGRAPRRYVVTLAPGERQALVVDAGAPVTTAASASASAPTSTSASPPPPVSSHAPPSASASAPAPAAGPAAAPGPRVGAWVATGISGAALATSLVTGALVLAKKGTIADHCPDRRCDDDGLAAIRASDRMATVSTIAFVAAGAAGGLAAYLWLRDEPVAVGLGVDGPRVRVRF